MLKLRWHRHLGNVYSQKYIKILGTIKEPYKIKFRFLKQFYHLHLEFYEVFVKTYNVNKIIM